MSKHLDLISINFVDDKCNVLLNDAITFAKDTKSASCEFIHLMFVAINNGYLDDFVAKNNIPLVYTKKATIGMLQDAKKIGTADSKHYKNGEWAISSVDYMGNSLLDFLFCELKMNYPVNDKHKISIKHFISEVIRYSTVDELVGYWCKEFLDNAELDIDSCNTAQIESLFIPSEIREYVTDLMLDTSIEKEVIFGVDHYITKAFEVLSRKVKANP